MSRDPYVLLPPSESKKPGGHPGVTPGFFDAALGLPREQLRRALTLTLDAASPAHASKVLNARGANLERARDAARQLAEGTALHRPAWQRYSGVVWTYLEPATLSERQRRRLLVPSGVYGLTTGTDEIADYRLTMKVSLDGLGNVARFWRTALTAALEELSDAPLVNLLPREHCAALATSDVLARRLVTVSFLQHDGARSAGHDAKAVKGALARRVLHDGLEAIEGFHWLGWRGKIHRGQYVVRAPRGSAR